MNSLRNTYHLILALLPMGIVPMLCFLCSSARGQDYEEMPLLQINGKPIQAWSQLTSAALDDKTKAVVGMLSGDPLDATVFDQYFNEIVFPLFTQWKDVKVGNKSVSPLAEGIGGINPPTMRARFKRDYASKASNPAAHEHLNDLTLAKMDQIASGNYHPVLRANAILMIADLNDADPNGNPWKKALPTLLKYATAADSIDAVRTPAWRGLVRHVQIPVDPAVRPQLFKAAISSLQSRNTLGNSTQDGKDWICRRAIDVLVPLYGPTPNSDISTALLDTINDNATSMTIRTAAAAALSKIKLALPPNSNPNALAKTLGQLAVNDSKNELEMAGAHHDPIIADRLAIQLNEIRQGLVGSDGNGGVRALATTPDFQQYVDSMIGPLDNLIAACGTKPEEAPTATSPAYGGTPVVIPIDRQKKIAEAITNAGNSLEAAVLRTEGTAPAAAVPGTAGPAGTPAKAPSNNPLDN